MSVSIYVHIPQRRERTRAWKIFMEWFVWTVPLFLIVSGSAKFEDCQIFNRRSSEPVTRKVPSSLKLAVLTQPEWVNSAVIAMDIDRIVSGEKAGLKSVRDCFLGDSCRLNKAFGALVLRFVSFGNATISRGSIFCWPITLVNYFTELNYECLGSINNYLSFRIHMPKNIK